MWPRSPTPYDLTRAHIRNTILDLFSCVGVNNKSFVMMAKLGIETGMLRLQFFLVEINEHSVISDGLVNQGHNKHALVSQNCKVIDPFKKSIELSFLSDFWGSMFYQHLTPLLTHYYTSMKVKWTFPNMTPCPYNYHFNLAILHKHRDIFNRQTAPWW